MKKKYFWNLLSELLSSMWYVYYYVSIRLMQNLLKKLNYYCKPSFFFLNHLRSLNPFSWISMINTSIPWTTNTTTLDYSQVSSFFHSLLPLSPNLVTRHYSLSYLNCITHQLRVSLTFGSHIQFYYSSNIISLIYLLFLHSRSFSSVTFLSREFSLIVDLSSSLDCSANPLLKSSSWNSSSD